ncbi:hypothetical protein V8D89_010532 [Ganoderma adspersum]
MPGKVEEDEWIKSHFVRNGTRPGNDRSHWNQWCSKCLDARTQELLDQEADRFAAGHLNVLRSEEEIRAEIMEHPSTTVPKAITSKLDLLVNHLVKCENITQVTRDEANVIKALQTQRSNANKENRILASSARVPASAYPSGTPSTPVRFSTTPINPMSSPSSSIPTARLFSETDLNLSEDGSSSRPEKQPRIATSSSTNAICVQPTSEPLPYLTQSEFQDDFARLLYTAGAAFRCSDIPYWRAFFQKWVPGSQLPSRQAIGGRILDRLAKDVVDAMQAHLRGRCGTGQSDGWKNIAKVSIIGSMINAEYEPHILHTYDVTLKAKTADNLLVIVEAEIKFCEDQLSITVVAWCTDGGGDCAKMRRLLKAKRPDLATPHCWAHQVRLTLGDYLKVKTPVTAALDAMLDAVSWFNNHSGASALLKCQQLKDYKQVLALIRPGATRWTGVFVAADRFLQTKTSVRILLVTSWDQLVAAGGTGADKVERTTALLSELKTDEFWISLKQAHEHIKPLAVASNATQGDHAQLDVVLITLANLYRIYSDTSRFSDSVRDTMHTSLEKRWKKAGPERELYLLAIIFNPSLRVTPFHPKNPLFSRQNIWLMFKRNYARMFQCDDPEIDIRDQLFEYLDHVGDWSDESIGLNDAKKSAARTRKSINLISLWRGVDTRGGGAEIVQFAIRLFSIVPNSAGTERFFSRLGLVQTKHWNRLHSDKARKLVLIKADIDQMYGTGRSEQHRHFGTTHEPTVLTHNSTPTSESSAATTSSSPPSHSFGNQLVQDTLGDSDPESSDGETEEPNTSRATARPRAAAGGAALRSSSVRRPNSNSSSSRPGQAIPRTEALCLRHLFDYPSTFTPSPTSSSLDSDSESDDESSCLLASFWKHCRETLTAERTWLEEADTVRSSAGTADDPGSEESDMDHDEGS